MGEIVMTLVQNIPPRESAQRNIGLFVGLPVGLKDAGMWKSMIIHNSWGTRKHFRWKENTTCSNLIKNLNTAWIFSIARKTPNRRCYSYIRFYDFCQYKITCWWHRAESAWEEEHYFPKTFLNAQRIPHRGRWLGWRWLYTAQGRPGHILSHRSRGSCLRFLRKEAGTTKIF